MWRRYGDVLYAILLSVVLTVEAAALAALTWMFLPSLSHLLPPLDLRTMLLAAVAVTAVALVVVAGFVLAYHSFSARRERLHMEALEQWSDRWVRVVVEHRPRPESPIEGAAVEALLDLREVLRGQEGERVDDLIQHYGVAKALVSQAAGARRRGLRGVLLPRRRQSFRGMAERLGSLESLAKARLQDAFPVLLEVLSDPQITVRLMALRGLARTIARMPTPTDKHRSAMALCDRLRLADLPGGAIEECFLLLEDTAPMVLRDLLERPEISSVAVDEWAADAQGVRRWGKAPGLKTRGPGSLLRAALDATGRLKLLDLGDRVGQFVTYREPEVRAAAIRALGRLGYLPAAAEPGLLAALRDEVEFVRVQAAHAAVLLAPETAAAALWDLLGDRSWWVRRAAGESLAQMAVTGVQGLERAAHSHPDRYARQMAVQILLDGGHLDAAGARRLRETG
ncbi:MAG: HEAT repeat domain-containing protein [Actinomycetota bacterium]